MVARALGVDEEQSVSTGISMAATHDAESERLRRPSPAVPYLSDTVCSVFRSAFGREDRVGTLRQSRGALVLLAVAAASRPISVSLAGRFAGLFRAVSVSNEHGESATARDCLHDHRDSPVFSAEISAE